MRVSQVTIKAKWRTVSGWTVNYEHPWAGAWFKTPQAAAVSTGIAVAGF